MEHKIIGAGMGRTGTASLQLGIVEDYLSEIKP